MIDQYAAGADEVGRALEGFPARGLTQRLLPGKWTAAEIVHHLADSESTSFMRIRTLLAQDHPLIHGYDQDAYAIRLRYNERDIAPSLAVLKAVRAGTVPLLRLMSDSDWTRAGWHTESGPYTPERWLEIYAAHAHNHAAQIGRRKGLATGRAPPSSGAAATSRSICRGACW